MNRNVLNTALSMTRYFAFTVAENQSHRLPYEFWRRTASFAMSRTQNPYFKAICMIRGSPADKILPKVELDRLMSGQTALVPVGGQGFTWLGMLKISARNMTDCFSRIRNVRVKLVSI